MDKATFWERNYLLSFLFLSFFFFSSLLLHFFLYNSLGEFRTKEKKISKRSKFSFQRRSNSKLIIYFYFRQTKEVLAIIASKTHFQMFSSFIRRNIENYGITNKMPCVLRRRCWRWKEKKKEKKKKNGRKERDVGAGRRDDLEGQKSSLRLKLGLWSNHISIHIVYYYGTSTIYNLILHFPWFYLTNQCEMVSSKKKEK